jgi:DNA-binding response OmpR family regulator
MPARWPRAGCGGAPILVVEDLTQEGLPVATSADGRQALDWARGHRPALVVLDMVLPKLDGEAVAQALREQYGAGVPILLVTGTADPGEHAEHMGAAMYLHKPFLLDDLLTAVGALLNAYAS